MRSVITGTGMYIPETTVDNHALASHRAMAAVLGAILRLPPVQRSMARGQLGSRYLDRLIEWNGERPASA